MLIDADGADSARELYRKAMLAMAQTISSKELLVGLERVAVSVESGRHYDALRLIRGLFPVEKQILDASRSFETAISI